MTENNSDKAGDNNLPSPIARKEQQNSGWLAALNPQNATRLIKGVGHIVGKASKYSNNLSQTIIENRAKDTISAAVANRISDGIAAADPEFERVFRREADRLLKEQSNLDAIAEIVTEDLSTKTDSDFESGALEDDWLYQFEHAAKGFSSERMKHTFARILSGEILKPGTFSPATLRALTTLSAAEAKLISIYVSMAFASHFEVLSPQLFTAGLSPGSNGLANFGLNYDNLSRLQQCGFLNHDLNTNRTIAEIVFTQAPGFVGARFVKFMPIEAPNGQRDIRIAGLLLTGVGAEICKVVERTPPPPEYFATLKRHFETKHKLTKIHT